LNQASSPPSPLDSARRKAYWHLLPLLFVCYMIAYVDRSNVAIAKLTMSKDLPAFDNAVIGFGAGIFFWGYFLLEVPGSLIVEKWSARKWICRIMITWGIMAALTAFVHVNIPGFTAVADVLRSASVAVLKPLASLSFSWLGWFSPVLDWMPSTSLRLLSQFEGANGQSIFQFYSVRFLLGLAEAGFFPGVVVYLTHWFPVRDRTRALALFFIATPVAQIISPRISNAFLKIGTNEVVNGVPVHHPELMGLEGWQWVYIIWGIPAVILGVMVLFMLKDRPRDARWLTVGERDALEQQLATEKAAGGKKRMTLMQALRHPLVLLLSLAYFCNVTANYGIEFFLPSILEQWYSLKLNAITWLVILPPVVALVAQLFVGWNSDRTRERRFHAVVPLVIASSALALAPFSQGNLFLTILCFMVAFGGLKAYLPAFWAMPSLFLTGPAAAGSIGLINSLGNLGGFFGPTVLGTVQKVTGSFVGGIYYLVGSILVSASILFFLGLGRKETAAPARSS
jgi:MFS transporter, ACS family, tartrate transporter